MKTPTLDIPTLTTQRLKLEPLSLSHSDGMFDMWRHAAVQKYSGKAEDEHRVEIAMPAQTHHDSDRLIGFWLRAVKDGWGFRWAIVLKESEAFVGHVGFNSLETCSEIAYHMNPDYWGRGIMFEAATAAMEWRYQQGTTSVEAYVDVDNKESIALTTRLGMSSTGEIREGAQRFLKSF